MMLAKQKSNGVPRMSSSWRMHVTGRLNLKNFIATAALDSDDIIGRQLIGLLNL